MGEKLPVIDPDEVDRLDGVFNAIGDTYHLVRVAPEPDPHTGQPVEQPPQKVPGSERHSRNAIPGSTTHLFPATIGQLRRAHKKG